MSIPPPLRVGIIDLFNNNIHGSEVTAAFIEGIEEQGYDVKLVAQKSKDVNNDGILETILNYDIDGDGFSDVEVVQIDGSFTNTGDVDFSGFNSSSLTKAINVVNKGEFGEFDFINCSFVGSTPLRDDGLLHATEIENALTRLASAHPTTKIYQGLHNMERKPGSEDAVYSFGHKKNYKTVSDSSKFRTVGAVHHDGHLTFSFDTHQKIGINVGNDNDYEVPISRPDLISRAVQNNPQFYSNTSGRIGLNSYITRKGIYSNVANSYAAPKKMGEEVVRTLLLNPHYEQLSMPPKSNN